MYKYKDLLTEFVVRDIKIKYRRSYLGVFWSLLNPFLTMLVITAVFSTIFRMDVENFPVYLLSGNVIYSYMSEATSTAMGSIVGNASLIKKIYVPKYLFVTSKVLSAIITLFMSCVALFIIAYVTKVKITMTVFLIILPIIYIIIFSLGVGYILATLNVFFRDISHLYGVILMVWMYATPIIYPINILPDNSIFKKIVLMNPLTTYVSLFRDPFMYGRIPDIKLQIIGFSIAIITFFVGYTVFKKLEHKFIVNI